MRSWRLAVTVRILSLDGGGIRSILQARMLVELEAIAGKPVAEQFEILIGSASGAVLALALAIPAPGGGVRYRAQQLFDLLLAQGERVFRSPPATRWLRRLGGLAPGRAPAALRRALGDLFDSAAFGESRAEVIVPTVDLDSRSPLLLRSGEFSGQSTPTMSEVALAALTVPGYLAPAEIELGAHRLHLADGGLLANNPSLFAYAAALAKADPSQVFVLSLGAGSPLIQHRHWIHHPASPANRWPTGTLRSLTSHLDLSSEAQHQALDSVLASLGFRQSYWRIQAPIETYAAESPGRAEEDPVNLAALAERVVEVQRPDLRAAVEALA